MAGHLGESRTGSLSLEGTPLMGGQETGETHQHHEEGPLAALARRSTKRNRSFRNKKVKVKNSVVMELQEALGSRRPSCESLVDQQHLHPSTYAISHRRSPSLRRGNSPSLARSPSPRRHYNHLHHDIGFSDTVSNVVEIVKHEHQKAQTNMKNRYIRGSWSASTSPARSPSPTGRRSHHPSRHGLLQTSRKGYGTTSLCQRSRSPSPTHLTPHQHGPATIAGAVVGLPMQQSAAHQSSMQHSHPMLGGRRGQGRRLPPTPSKPSTLQLRPGPINFPKLNASPTHMQSHSAHATPHGHIATQNIVREREPLREIMPPTNYEGSQAPLSFEQAVALGRGGRMLPSPVPNGYKPKPTRSRHSDSDDDDWC